MKLTLILMISGFLSVLIAGLVGIRLKKADQRSENQELRTVAKGKYAALCAPDETVRVICQAHLKKPYFYVLTTKRLILDLKKRQEIPVSEIKSVKLYDARGNKTKYLSQAIYAKLKAGKKVTLVRCSASFEELVAAISG